MRSSLVFRCVISATAVAASLYAAPALATRTVVDFGQTLSPAPSGYCSPGSSAPSNCTYQFASTAAPLVIDGTTYGSFYVNSNGTVSLAPITSFIAAENSAGATGEANLSAFGVPVFSPFFSDGAGVVANPFDSSSGFDGNLVSNTQVTATGFNVDFYTCATSIICGPRTADIIAAAQYSDNPSNSLLQNYIIDASTLNDPNATAEANFLSGQAALIAQAQATIPIYTIGLVTLSDGLQVDLRYNVGALGDPGTYGFFIPGGASLQGTGPLENRTFLFDAGGNLVTSVPEPSTWMSMLLGFGVLGFALRWARPAFQTA